jgi:superoxide dismutase, Fe-Mn family
MMHLFSLVNVILLLFTLPTLPYSFQALEPNIDAQTMEIHLTKHHRAYITNLNNAIAGTDLVEKSLDDLLKMADKYSVAVRNNAGGHWNHSMYWTMLSPTPATAPSGSLAVAMDQKWESLDKFKEAFNKVAMARFGSGWAWLCVDSTGLSICSTANQDNPLMPDVGCSGTPILCMDLWEHAYYLKYQNKRADYIAAFWRVLDWDAVEANYEKFFKMEE